MAKKNEKFEKWFAELDKEATEITPEMEKKAFEAGYNAEKGV